MLRFVVSPDPRAEAPPARDNIEPVAALLLEAEPRHQRARKARRGRVGSASSRPRGTGRSDRPQIERLCRYVTRPPLAEDRLQLRSDDGLELTLKKTLGAMLYSMRQPLTGLPWARSFSNLTT